MANDMLQPALDMLHDACHGKLAFDDENRSIAGQALALALAPNAGNVYKQAWSGLLECLPEPNAEVYSRPEMHKATKEAVCYCMSQLFGLFGLLAYFGT